MRQRPDCGTVTYSPAFRWGLIEASSDKSPYWSSIPYSPAFRWGLIEAYATLVLRVGNPKGIPRHFAGASLKRLPLQDSLEPSPGYSPAFRWGLIEATRGMKEAAAVVRYSPAFRWGLIEAAEREVPGFKQLSYSPAFRWGLIEASSSMFSRSRSMNVFPGISLGPH